MALRQFDLIVAGGGAAGIMAGGIASGRGLKVLVCERMEKPQRKVRITGKGRCNLTNTCAREDFLSKIHGVPSFLEFALDVFSSRDTILFFERLGVSLTQERGGRIFPQSGRAWDIADAHVKWCRSQGARIECRTEVCDVLTEGNRIAEVVLRTPQGVERVTTSCLLLATGGASYPATGSDGNGYGLVHRLGHTVIGVRPSLTPLESDLRGVETLQGLLLKNVSAKLIVGGTCVQEEFGELEFTPNVGGAIALRMSRRAVDGLIDNQQVAVDLDLKPALTHDQLTERIVREKKALGADFTLASLLRKLLPGTLSVYFCRWMQCPDSWSRGTSDEKWIEMLVSRLKCFSLPISDYRPFTEAIVTAGGVDTSQVDPHTMQSRLVRGLYFAGELLDLDGDTGGYNLQIAYSTGFLAGREVSI